MTSPCLILDVTEAMEEARGRPEGVELIPQALRPTVLQPNRDMAEREALRLAARFPGRRFAVFQAAAMAQTIDVPTHVSITGQVLVRGTMPALFQVGHGEEVPF